MQYHERVFNYVFYLFIMVLLMLTFRYVLNKISNREIFTTNNLTSNANLEKRAFAKNPNFRRDLQEKKDKEPKDECKMSNEN